MKNKDLCVPAKALALGEDAVAPAVGDTVSVTIEGKVSKVAGEQVYVTPATANGQPMIGAKPEPAEEGEEGPSREELVKELQGMGY